jgi:hypothetical protein
MGFHGVSESTLCPFVVPRTCGWSFSFGTFFPSSFFLFDIFAFFDGVLLVLDSTTDLYRIDALLFFCGWHGGGLPVGSVFFFLLTFSFDIFDGALLRCSPQLRTFWFGILPTVYLSPVLRF